MITKEILLNYLAHHRLAVLATTNASGQPEAALVGYGITDHFEIVFDTTTVTRKYSNLVLHPKVALVIGWNDERTVQYEGMARQLGGREDDYYRAVYFSAFPDGPDRAANWPDLAHFVVTPTWIRYSSFGGPMVKEEWAF